MTAEPVNREALARDIQTIQGVMLDYADNTQHDAWVRLTEALSRPDAEREEPVAWCVTTPNDTTLFFVEPETYQRNKAAWLVLGWIMSPLYAAPPIVQPVAETVKAGITDEMVERGARAVGRELKDQELSGAFDDLGEEGSDAAIARACLTAALRPSAHGEAG